QFERRMETDPEVRERVNSATRSIELIQNALNWATPDTEFDTKVTSRIQEISQSKMQPVEAGVERNLTQNDPKARLLTDQAGDREKRRLLWIALSTALVFAVAVYLIVHFVIHR